MRAQTTLEFLILLSAAASLSVFAISVYSSITSAQKPLYQLLGQVPTANSVSNVPAQKGNNVGIYASIANVTYVNKSNSLDVLITSNPGSMLSEVYVTGTPNVAVIPAAYRNISSEGLAVLTFSIIPRVVGVVKLSVAVIFSDPDGNPTRNAYVETYAAPAGTGTNNTSKQGNEFAASLTRSNESILYGISGGVSAYTALMWSHCSSLDWGYGQLPMGAQCGNANWYFWNFDPDCYWNHGIYYKTYCVKLNPTNTTVSPIQNAQSYGYNVSLVLYNVTERLTANLSDLKSASPLDGGSGQTHGNAIIGSVSGVGPQPYSNYVVLNTSGAMRAVNMSYYSTYLQYFNNLNSFMNYYNHTGGDPGTASQDISYFNSETASFINAPSASYQQCRISAYGGKSYYSCSPLSGLYYNIDASIDVFHGNQSIAVQGSAINIK